MPFMNLWKGHDNKWHLNPCSKTNREKGIFLLLTGESLKIGGCGNHPDPPSKDMCHICFPWHVKVVRRWACRKGHITEQDQKPSVCRKCKEEDSDMWLQNFTEIITHPTQLED